MRHLEALLKSLRTTGHERTPSAARFVLETRDNSDAAEVRRRAQAVFGSAEIGVDRALDSTDPALSRFFVLKVMGAAPGVHAAGAMDLGYDLEHALDLASVDVLGDEAPHAMDPDMGESFAALLDSDDDPEWHLRSIRAEEAWGRTRGAGILIGQPDTGIADHHLLTGAVVMEHGNNLIERGSLPYDPLRGGSGGSSGSSGSSSGGNPGHGTSVAGNAVSRGNGADRRIRGVAPEAMVMPVRCVESVVLSDFQAGVLSEAIDRAGARCQVISMSLGGVGAFLAAITHAAIKRVAEKGVVFVAAAGNYTAIAPVYPGIDYFCACIAGSTKGDQGWSGSGGGLHVTVSAPAEGVWTAWRGPNDGYATTRVGAGNGTSYATAIVGGVAALWIAHHGHANLIRRYGAGWKVTKAFQELLRRTARVPSGWNTSYYGAGIVDADALLRASLDDTPVHDASPEHGARRELREQLVAAPGVEAVEVDRLDDALLDRYGREISLHLRHANHARGGRLAAARPALSETLRTALTGAKAASIAGALST